MGESEFIRPFVRRIFSRQRRNGGISAFPNVGWTCSVGLAQLAVIAYKLGMRREADAAVDHLCRIQNPSGGFYGSYGLGASYFPQEEISWANKFFLDAVHMKTKLPYARDNHAAPREDEVSWTVLDAKRWYDTIIARGSVDSLARNIRSGQFPVWCKPLLQHTSPGDSTLELGSGTGQLSAILGIYGRVPHLLDFSKGCIEFGKRLFHNLGIEGHFSCADILKGIPLRKSSVDWVWSSGVLEHLSDEQIAAVLKESARVCAKGVMSLVPNANSIFYRVGKFRMEMERTWRYGKERPMSTMKKYFEAAGLTNVTESSVGAYHSLEFFGSDRKEIRNFYDSLSLKELESLNQGYLLFTYGER